MNKELKDRIFTIPQNILDKINHTMVGLGGTHVNGVNRAKKLLFDKKVKYGQLKRILHDLENSDILADRVKYDLAGGDLMLKWCKQFLENERSLIKNRKQDKKNADEMGGLTGFRKNTHLKKHSKKPDFLPPVNMIKSNSNRNSISTLKSMKLFEEINKIKNLIIY
jgi:hypothetical protein